MENNINVNKYDKLVNELINGDIDKYKLKETNFNKFLNKNKNNQKIDTVFSFSLIFTLIFSFILITDNNNLSLLTIILSSLIISPILLFFIIFLIDNTKFSFIPFKESTIKTRIFITSRLSLKLNSDIISNEIKGYLFSDEIKCKILEKIEKDNLNFLFLEDIAILNKKLNHEIKVSNYEFDALAINLINNTKFNKKYTVKNNILNNALNKKKCFSYIEILTIFISLVSFFIYILINFSLEKNNFIYSYSFFTSLLITLKYYISTIFIENKTFIPYSQDFFNNPFKTRYFISSRLSLKNYTNDYLNFIHNSHFNEKLKKELILKFNQNNLNIKFFEDLSLINKKYTKI